MAMMRRLVILVVIALFAFLDATSCGVSLPVKNVDYAGHSREPAPTQATDPPPMPNPKIDFPLALNNTWVFQATRYVGYPPPDVMTATLVITETVVDVQNVSSHLIAKIRQDRSAEMPLAVPESRQSELRAAESRDYWLVLQGNRLYRQDKLDLSKLEEALVEFVFPLKAGDQWALTANQAKLLPPGKKPGMTREVVKMGTVDVPAGHFAGCSLLREEWVDATIEDWFCPNVGIVDSKGDHLGAPETEHRVLIRYQLEDVARYRQPEMLQTDCVGCLPPLVSTIEGLTVEEYPLVNEDEDAPGRMEYYQKRIDPAILEKRRAWRERDPEGLANRINRDLAKFGYWLAYVERRRAPVCYELHRGDQLAHGEIRFVWPVTVNARGDDFALLVETVKGEQYLVRNGRMEPWNAGEHAYQPPVYVGDRLVAVAWDWDPRRTRVSVKSGEETLYSTEVPAPGADSPVKGLWSWDGKWVLEVKGQVVIDSKSLNEELGYEEVFDWRLLGGEPFYFFQKDGLIGVSYAGRVLPQRYDEVIHYQCCEPAFFNPRGNDAMVTFHALRDGKWYYVEMGAYD